MNTTTLSVFERAACEATLLLSGYAVAPESSATDLAAAVAAEVRLRRRPIADQLQALRSEIALLHRQHAALAAAPPSSAPPQCTCEARASGPASRNLAVAMPPAARSGSRPPQRSRPPKPPPRPPAGGRASTAPAT